MSTLKKQNLEGQEVGKVQIDKAWAESQANGQMIKEYIVALRANARQWSANTKGRSEVSHSTKKPHPQKGGGRSRQGSLAAPQYKGGGRVFTPKPKFDQHIKINKKERQAAIRFLIGEKVRDGRLHVLDSTNMDEPKTKTVASFLKATKSGNRVLFLGESNVEEIKVGDVKKKINVRCDQHDNFIVSIRNLPKTEFSLATNISGYDVILANDIYVTEAALKELHHWLM